jgi:hypothetical protein
LTFPDKKAKKYTAVLVHQKRLKRSQKEKSIFIIQIQYASKNLIFPPKSKKNSRLFFQLQKHKLIFLSKLIKRKNSAVLVR